MSEAPVFANGAYTAAFQHLFNSEARGALSRAKAAHKFGTKALRASEEEYLAAKANGTLPRGATGPREYGGYIYEITDPDTGAISYQSSEYAKGDWMRPGVASSVNIASINVPEGATVVGMWHTHPGGYVPEFRGGPGFGQGSNLSEGDISVGRGYTGNDGVHRFGINNRYGVPLYMTRSQGFMSNDTETYGTYRGRSRKF